MFRSESNVASHGVISFSFLELFDGDHEKCRRLDAMKKEIQDL